MTGASWFPEGKLLSAQKKCVTEILSEIRKIADDSIKLVPARSDLNGYDDKPDAFGGLQQQYNFMTIDGERGTGKTTIVRALSYYAHYLGDGERTPIDDDKDFEDILERPLRDRHSNGHRTVRMLNTVYPEMFGQNETELPDLVFDQIRQDLQDQVSEVRFTDDLHEMNERRAREVLSSLRGTPEATEQLVRSRQRAEQLLNELREKVDPAWTYARNLGREVLSRDSVNYREYVEQKGRYSSLATKRHLLWRDFIDRYLDFKQSQLLMLTLDDCDLSPDRAIAVLDDLRMYLSHPRVVVVTAMKFDALRHVTQIGHYRRIAPVLGMLSASVSRRDEDYRPEVPEDTVTSADRRADVDRRVYDMLEFQDSEIEADLQKILPPYLRFNTPQLGEGDAERVLFPDEFVGQEADKEGMHQVRLASFVLGFDASSPSTSRTSSLPEYFWLTRYPGLFLGYTLRDLLSIKRQWVRQGLRIHHLLGAHSVRQNAVLGQLTSERERNSAIRLEVVATREKMSLVPPILPEATTPVERKTAETFAGFTFDSEQGVAGFSNPPRYAPRQFSESLTRLMATHLNRPAILDYPDRTSELLPLNMISAADHPMRPAALNGLLSFREWIEDLNAGSARTLEGTLEAKTTDGFENFSADEFTQSISDAATALQEEWLVGAQSPFDTMITIATAPTGKRHEQQFLRLAMQSCIEKEIRTGQGISVKRKFDVNYHKRLVEATGKLFDLKTLKLTGRKQIDEYVRRLTSEHVLRPMQLRFELLYANSVFENALIGKRSEQSAHPSQFDHAINMFKIRGSEIARRIDNLTNVPILGQNALGAEYAADPRDALFFGVACEACLDGLSERADFGLAVRALDSLCDRLKLEGLPNPIFNRHERTKTNLDTLKNALDSALESRQHTATTPVKRTSNRKTEQYERWLGLTPTQAAAVVTAQET